MLRRSIPAVGAAIAVLALAAATTPAAVSASNGSSVTAVVKVAPTKLSKKSRVFFEPGENHWHGAAPDRFMTHLVIREADETGSPVNWGRHVTDEEYGAR